MDWESVSPGRGAYACPSEECLTGAFAKGRLAHAFKRPTAPPREPVTGVLTRCLERAGTKIEDVIELRRE